MLPVSAVVIAIFKFLPTLAVFLAIRTVLGLPFAWEMFWAIPVLLITMLLVIGSCGDNFLYQVYFRDIASSLPT